jgi:glutamate---cysteine ligase / carboxylate-amine ligase
MAGILWAVEHAFGRAAAFRLGVEEELLLVDPGTIALSHCASQVLPRVRQTAGEVKFDVYEALVETSSPVCDDAGAGTAALAALRRALADAGATTIGCGIHPSAVLGDAAHVPGERYERIAADMAGLLRRTPTCALHVHVGMPDGDACVRAANALRTWLPLLQALAAHSPWWHGIDSGFASARAQLFRGYPRGYVPPAWESWAHYEDWTGEVVAAAGVEDYTFLWWDLRPHPRLGTLEVRAMDAQSALWSVEALSALVHGLAVRGAQTGGPAIETAVLVESSFRAGRDGLGARLWDGERMRPVREVAAQALAIAPDAAPGVERILREGNGADRMRAAHRRGGMRAVLEHLRAETGAYG